MGKGSLTPRNSAASNDSMAKPGPSPFVRGHAIANTKSSQHAATFKNAPSSQASQPNASTVPVSSGHRTVNNVADPNTKVKGPGAFGMRPGAQLGGAR